MDFRFIKNLWYFADVFSKPFRYKEKNAVILKILKIFDKITIIYVLLKKQSSLYSINRTSWEKCHQKNLVTSALWFSAFCYIAFLTAELSYILLEHSFLSNGTGGDDISDFQKPHMYFFSYENVMNKYIWCL